jgi:hypothetical protein
VFLFAGVVSGWLLCVFFGSFTDSSIIAASWGDGKYGKHFYGAQVYLIPDGTEFSVRARVFIGRPGSNYLEDFGQIGHAKSVQEAIDRFGIIHWDDKGLTIGDPASGGFHQPRARLESHR